MKSSLAYLTLTVFLLMSCGKKSETPDASKAIDTIPMLVERVQKSSRLYTSEYRIHKIITHTDEVKAEGTFFNKKFSINLPFGDRRVAIPLDAVVKAYIDFSDFNEENVKKEGNGKITIILPDPRIVLTSTKIDHKGMKEFVPFMRHNFTDAELTNYERQGRKQIINSIGQMGIIEHAQESAAKQLIPMLKMLGYKQENITISFRKQFTMADITRFIENSTIQNNKKDE